jgi:hypothetical protein
MKRLVEDTTFGPGCISRLKWSKSTVCQQQTRHTFRQLSCLPTKHLTFISKWVKNEQYQFYHFPAAADKRTS